MNIQGPGLEAVPNLLGGLPTPREVGQDKKGDPRPSLREIPGHARRRKPVPGALSTSSPLPPRKAAFGPPASPHAKPARARISVPSCSSPAPGKFFRRPAGCSRHAATPPQATDCNGHTAARADSIGRNCLPPATERLPPDAPPLSGPARAPSWRSRFFPHEKRPIPL